MAREVDQVNTQVKILPSLVLRAWSVISDHMFYCYLWKKVALRLQLLSFCGKIWATFMNVSEQIVVPVVLILVL